MKNKFIIVFVILVIIIISSFIGVKSNKIEAPTIQVSSEIKDKTTENKKSNEEIGIVDKDKLLLEEIENIQEKDEISETEELKNIEERYTENETPIYEQNEVEHMPAPKEEIKDSIIQEQPKNEQRVEVKKESDIPRCSGNNHKVGAGNSNEWFNSKYEAINYYDELIKIWGDKWENFEIDSETYDKVCPYGYEVWSCPICNKWTINFYYRQ